MHLFLFEFFIIYVTTAVCVNGEGGNTAKHLYSSKIYIKAFPFSGLLHYSMY